MAFVFIQHVIIYINVLFIKLFIICLRAPLISLFSADLHFRSAAVSSFWQLFTQSATKKLGLNMAIRWHTDICNRHNQSNTDAISNFITPFQSVSLSHFQPSPLSLPSSAVLSMITIHLPVQEQEREIDEGGE